MIVKLTRVTYDPVGAIDEAAANCYDTKDYKEGALMRGCISSGHLSVTEFAHFNFHIEGVSRALTHQLVRHRLASFAQRSQRYCGENGFNYVTPHTIKTDEQLEIYDNLMAQIDNVYTQLQNLGVPNEDARYILPNACETAIEVSMNLRELMHFMNERLCARAQWEIRELAQKMKELIIKEFPEFKKYLVPKCEKYGADYAFCPEAKGCGRHASLKEIYKKEEDRVIDITKEIDTIVKALMHNEQFDFLQN